MSILRLDYETTSSCDITNGAYRYASDPSTRILMFAVAKDDEDPVLWDYLNPDSPESLRAVALFSEAIESGGEIHAFNAGFEAAISMYRLKADVGIDPPELDQWRCTQALARVASIPASLAKAAEFLRVEDKDASGKSLIHIFSDKNRVVTLRKGKETLKANDPLALKVIPWDYTLTLQGTQVTLREAWERMKSYCRQDVVVERLVGRKLERFTLTGSELEGFLFTLKMNTLGAPVNIDAVNHAATLIEEHQANLEKEFVEITGLLPSQRARVLAWLQTEGYPSDNLQAATVKELKDSDFLSEKGKKALSLHSDLSFAAIKKVAAMQNTVCPDNTLKGMFTWCGASATGRWTSQGVQLQNARRSTIKNPDLAYRFIREKADLETLDICFGNPYETIASCIRNFIQPHEGKMYSVDYSNIESRVAAWLAGQEDLLNVYREGRDAYKELASVVFNVPIDQVTKEQRFVGKVGNLSLVFQTGAKTFHETCAMWGNPIPKKVACDTVRKFREVNHMFPVTWRKYEQAMVKAIQNPGEWFEASPFVSFASSRKAPFHRLVMRLPSGRQLIYPGPEVKRAVKRHTDYETGETREWETDDITYYGQQAGSVHWGRVNFYAGMAFQNSVQGTARDIAQHGCVNATKKGYRIFSIIHDEVLSHEHPLGAEGLTEALCSHPEWLPPSFPLAAAGGECDYYTKD